MQVPDRVRAVLFYFIAGCAAALLQVSLPDRTLGLAAKPDFLLVLPILAGFLFGPVEGACAGAFCGFLADSFSGATIGGGVLVGLYAGLLSAFLFRRLFRKGLLSALLQVAVVGGAAYVLVEAAGLVFFGPGSLTAAAWAAAFLGRALPLRLALDAAAAVPLFLLLRYAGPHRRPTKRIGSEEAARGLRA